MLHNIVLILLGLVLFDVLAAILETLGLKKPSLRRSNSFRGYYRRGSIPPLGYHNWRTNQIVVAIGFAYLQILKQFLGQSTKEPK